MMKQRESEMRPAEDVAREMVDEGDLRGPRLLVDGEVRDGTEEAVRFIASAITRARAEGAAAERARQQPHSKAVETARSTMDQAHACFLANDGLAAQQHLSRALEALAGEPPRDLAGRIRALVCEYAGRWADARGTEAALLYGALASVREAHTLARNDVELAGLIEQMRLSPFVEIRRAADELEAIVRECEEKR